MAASYSNSNRLVWSLYLDFQGLPAFLNLLLVTPDTLMEIFVGLEAEPQDVCRGKRRWEKRKVYKGLKRSCVYQDIEERLDIVTSKYFEQSCAASATATAADIVLVTCNLRCI